MSTQTLLLAPSGVKDYFKQLSRGPDHTVVTASLGFVEASLGTLLQSALRGGPVTDHLLRGPLASLGARANAAYAMDLIDDSMHKDLARLGSIRSYAAARHLDLSFADEELAALCMKLDYLLTLKKSEHDAPLYTPDELLQRGAKKRFSFTALVIVEKLLRRSEVHRSVH